MLKTDPTVTWAIKSYNREEIAKNIKMLEVELSILKTIDHPNIVKLEQCYIDDKYVHIVTKYYNGGELFDNIVAAKRFTEHRAADLISQMIDAVVYLHKLGIVHRDLKPENFLMEDTSDNSKIKMIDFGSSKRFNEH